MPRWTGTLAFGLSILFLAFGVWNLYLFVKGEREWPVGIVGALVMSWLLFRASNWIEFNRDA